MKKKTADVLETSEVCAVV